MPNSATVEDILRAYSESWRLGLKAIAIYRDGCKRTQPLNTSAETDDAKKYKAVRHRLADERTAITHKFSVAGHEGYITVGLYESGQPGEIFITMSKEGSTISGLMDAFATSVSMALQYGVPLRVLVEKFSHMRFEPSGFTNNKDIPIAKSVCDYIFRWLGTKFLPKDILPISITSDLTLEKEEDTNFMSVATREGKEREVYQTQSDAPPCHECGNIMIRSGSCYKCLNCGATSGCS
jgi:ribonucleoside-diphosphate reductase alpha chain